MNTDTVDLSSLTIDTFRPLVGDDFAVLLDSTSIPLALREVMPLSKHTQEVTGRLPFSLLFAGPLTPLFEQRIYTLEHAAVGNFSVFMVPLGPKGGHMQYEVIFT